MLLAALAAFAAVVSFASADELIADGDADNLVADESSVTIGTVAPGATVTRHVGFKLRCEGKQHADSGQTVSISLGAVSVAKTGGGATTGASLTAAAGTTVGSVPTSWPDDTTGGGSTNCASTPQTLGDNGDITVEITAPSAPGTYTYQATFNSALTPAGNGDPAAIKGDPTVTYTLTVPANTAPSAPGAPALTAGFSSPNTGLFGLGWTAATDADGNTLTYALQHRDADDAGWSSVATGLTSASYAFGLPLEQEGTWTYRASANDGTVSGPASPASSAVKVDRSAPSAPTASTTPATPAYSGDGGWFKDSVEVSFGGSSDPDLPDGSAGAGGVTYQGGGTADTTGTHDFTGTAKDALNNTSAGTAKGVKVDASDPELTLTCPTEVLRTGETATASFIASDTGSGLAGAASGTVALDTATSGSHTKAHTVADNVGNEGSDDCGYSVNTPPTTPGTVSSDEDRNADGEHTLTWDASTDADGHDIEYRLERKDADDADWSTVADGLTGTSYAFGAGGNDAEGEGTFNYRAIATDGTFESDPSGASDEVKVDRSDPNAPQIGADRDPDYDGDADDDWYLDTVTLTSTDQGDPALADGSDGSGVDAASVASPLTASTSGEHTLTDSVLDNVGNESGSASKTVNVDADVPNVDIDGCPTGPLHTGDAVSVDVTASDDESGLAEDPSGSVALNTLDATPHAKSLTVTAVDNVGHDASDTCEYTVNTAPTTPGTVSSDEAQNADGEHTLTWGASTDADGDAIEYALERKDADDSGWSEVASGLTGTSYAFGAGGNDAEGEGTFTYRAIASDGTFDSDASAPSDEVKVDKSDPNAPNIDADRSADYQVGSTDWFKDAATLSFSSAGDPALTDTSLGSGVDLLTLPAGDSRNTTGALHVEGTVRDQVGNESALASRTVQVDATDPAVSLTCPSGLVTVGSGVQATFSASDVGSGLQGSSSGGVNVDTTSAGDVTAVKQVADNVGHTASDTCSATVRRWTGFYSPVDNAASNRVNLVKAGSSVPIKFSLDGYYHAATPSSIFFEGYPRSQAATCDSNAELSGDTPTVAAGSSSLQYDPSTDQYTYVWKTVKDWATTSRCRQLVLRLSDGSYHRANFRFH